MVFKLILYFSGQYRGSAPAPGCGAKGEERVGGGPGTGAAEPGDRAQDPGAHQDCLQKDT